MFRKNNATNHSDAYTRFHPKSTCRSGNLFCGDIVCKRAGKRLLGVRRLSDSLALICSAALDRY